MTRVPTERELNIIRGKNLVGQATKEDVDRIFVYIDHIETKLDYLDNDDFFGQNGWRHFLSLPDSD